MDEKANERLWECFQLMREHLDYCGYGDNWERECAYHQKLPDKVEKVFEEQCKLRGI